MIVKFLEDTEVEDRLYLAGQSHEFETATALLLIAEGAAQEDPNYAAEHVAPKHSPAKAAAKPAATKPKAKRTRAKTVKADQ